MFLLVPDGPDTTRSAGFDPTAIKAIFTSPRFRASAFGYFGHMWELYALWAFVPLLLAGYAERQADLDISLWSFAVIAAGAVGCVAGGLISLRRGSARVAYAQLLASGLCCLASPLAFQAPPVVFLAFLLFWGAVVAGDSPQFSALNARYAPPALVGSALTIANCIGFSITIISIQTLSALAASVDIIWLFVPLAIGPALGLLALRPLVSPEDTGR
ncbi:MAG TPA: MFS transporter, partial [Halomonas sp.]|nr:MFS transporter [Halomonas sp.]